jgi:predicted acyl esterase
LLSTLRIRLDVSSSNFPHFDVNPNTAAPEGKGLVRRVLSRAQVKAALA